MQYALTELFEARQDRLLTLQGMNHGRGGGGTGKPGRTYLPGDGQGCQGCHPPDLPAAGDLRRWQCKNTRRRAAPNLSLITEFSDKDMVEEILDTFTAYRLISMDHDPGHPHSQSWR